MSKIEILPQDVIEKIAAGEVVERPASVLKELIENSLDADSSKIDILIEDAGFSLIRICDNGSGMACGDLEKCLLRYATSKIRSADDLYAIATMGFRGEALASIASVSRLSIETSDENSGLGSAVKSDGGAQQNIIPVRHLRGTTISVRDLFFNVPARKKFMKTKKGEQLAIIRMVEQIVIPFPSVHFSLTVDAKRILDIPSVQSVSERIAQVAGPQFAKTLLFCRGERTGIEADIYVSTPEQLKERPRFQSLYVNLRRIDNESVTFAVREAFSQFLGFGYKPSFFCFLSIDPSRIDVNVHPTKQIVKFEDERELFGFIYSVVKSEIAAKMGSVPQKSDVPLSAENYDSRQTKPADLFAMSVREPVGIYSFPEQKLDSQSQQVSQTILNLGAVRSFDEKEVDQTRFNTIQLSKDEPQEIWELIPCYQIHGVFILAPIKNGILLIDQHAAHERVLFEQALEDIKNGRSASQQLLFPVVVELTPTEKAIVESGRGYFNAFGFNIEDFGGNALSISAIPAFLKDSLIESSIRETVKFLLEGKDVETFLEPEKRFAAAFACGAAIKAGQKLSQEEMNALLNSLFSTKNPYICPHGRPTLVRISIDELSRRFLR
jgi:DNA mismatch repair protein MutL